MTDEAPGEAAKGPAGAELAAAPARRRSRSWLYEAPVFYLLLTALQRGLYPDDPGFHIANPSPYWLGVLLFGLRYGIAAGAYAGLISAGLYVQGFSAGGEPWRLEDADAYILPGLFVVFGASLGAATDRFLMRIGSLDTRIGELQGRVKGLLDQMRAQQRTLRAVEQQVVSQMSSVVTLYHGSKELGSLEREKLLGGVLDFSTRALQATKTALYVPADGRWRVKETRGWAAGDAYPAELAWTEGLVGRAGSEKRVVSLRDWLPAEPGAEEAAGGPAAAPAASAPRTDAIMAAPLVEPGGGVAAVLSVQAMPFLRFNSAAVNLLTLLADWAGEALEKCASFEDLRGKSIVDEATGVLAVPYFESRLRQEFKRSARHALPFSLVLTSLRGAEGLAPERRALALRALARLLQKTVREIDVVTRTPLAEAPFAVLAMTATREQAGALCARLREAYARLELPFELRLGVGSYQSETKAPEELLEQARQELG